MTEEAEQVVPTALVTPDDATGPKGRGFELARGLALVGMIAVNYHLVMTFGRPRASLEPALAQSILEGLFGRATAAFVLLAGLGLAFRMRNRDPEPRHPAKSFAARLALILFLAVALLSAALHATFEQAGRLAIIDDLGKTQNWRDLVHGLEAGLSGDFSAVGARIILPGAALLFALTATFIIAPRIFQGARGRTFLRALFLIGLGYIWQPMWRGDILHAIGFFMLLAIPLMRAPSWLLVFLIAACPIGAAAIQWRFEFGAGWDANLRHLGFWTGMGQLRDLVFDGWFPLLPWFGFLLAGLLLGRARLDRLRAPFFALVLGTALVLGAPFLSRQAVKLAIDAVDLGPGFQPAAAPLPAPTETHDDGAAPRPGLPAFASHQIPVALAPDHVDPAALAGGRFLAGRLGNWPIASMTVRPAQGGSRLVIGLRAGTDEKGRNDLATTLHRWLLGLDSSERPAWPVALKEVEVAAPTADGGSSSVVLDAERPGRLPHDERLRELFSLQAIPPGPIFFLQALGSALALVGLSFLLGRIEALRTFLHPLVATGRMALTLYLVHIIVGMGLLGSLKLLTGQGLPLAVTVIAVVAALAMALASAWLALFGRGPFEGLMRRLCR